MDAGRPAGRSFRRGLILGLLLGGGLVVVAALGLALMGLGVLGGAALELFQAFVDILWGH
ncbi:MAG: hypothetical protein KC933_16305 [Myxococcales bacterium]|nr:hypothetical protein [Myxococcales bacterium]